jgi:hypothetical protein
MKEEAKEMEELKAHDRRLRELDYEEIAAKNMVKQVEVEIRNRLIAREMRGKLRDLSGSKKAPDLRMLFVSSTEYQKHRKGYELKEPPVLDGNATGYPQVRHLLYSGPSRSKFNALARICRARLPNAFYGINGILTKSRLERKQDVEKLIIFTCEQNESLLDGMVQKLKVASGLAIATPFGKSFNSWTVTGHIRSKAGISSGCSPSIRPKSCTNA